MIDEKDIYRPHNNKTPTVAPKNTVKYCLFGEHDMTDEKGNPIARNDSVCLAYKETKNNRLYFYVRIDSTGSLYNPLNQFQPRHEKSRHNIGKENNPYMETNEEAFDWYLSFLKTKNEARLREAQRKAI